MLRRTEFLILCVACCLTCFAGCTEPGKVTYQVKGHLHFNEQPIEYGFVTFVPEDGRAVRVSTDAAGNYTATLPAGHYRVAVLAVRADEVQEVVSAVDAPDRAPPTPDPSSPQTAMIPDRFSQYDSSGLAYEVKGSQENIFNIDL